jgi:hypothetical protein
MVQTYAPLGTWMDLMVRVVSASTQYRYGPKRVNWISARSMAPQRAATGAA